jgi:hypothetical protein
MAGAATSERDDHATTWQRRPHECVDVHHTLPRLETSPRCVWETLSAATVPITVGGTRMRALSEGGRAFHVALHAAQHGPDAEKALRDLTRAVERLSPAAWDEAAAMADALDATAVLGAGLGLAEGGRRIAARLALDDEPSPGLALVAAGVPPPLAVGLERFRRTPGIAGKARVLAREAVPTPAFMRVRHARARNGHTGLVAAYVERALWLTRQTPAAWRAWRGTRR